MQTDALERFRIGCTTALTLLLGAVSACSGTDETLSPLAQQGRRTYQNLCIACHNGNPNRDGSPGPAIAGSSAELLEARVLRGEYPPGYTPKQPTAAMPRFEFLADEIEALVAYLAEAQD